MQIGKLGVRVRGFGFQSEQFSDIFVGRLIIFVFEDFQLGRWGFFYNNRSYWGKCDQEFQCAVIFLKEEKVVKKFQESVLSCGREILQEDYIEICYRERERLLLRYGVSIGEKMFEGFGGL